MWAKPTPAVKLDNWQYSEATWARNVLQVTMNTGERYQFMNVPRRLAISFVRNPQEELLKGCRFERVRGRGDPCAEHLNRSYPCCFVLTRR